MKKLQRSKTREKMIMLKNILQYIYFDSQFKEMWFHCFVGILRALLWQVHLWYHRIVGSCCCCRKNPNIQIFHKLVELVLRTIYIQKTILKLGVNHVVFKLGGTTTPAFHTKHFNIAGSWRSYRKNIHI